MDYFQFFEKNFFERLKVVVLKKIASISSYLYLCDYKVKFNLYAKIISTNNFMFYFFLFR